MTTRSYLTIAASLLGVGAIGIIVATAISAGGLPLGDSLDSRRLHTVAGNDPGTIPSSEAGAMARLNSSPRHGEWVTIQAGKNPVTGRDDSTRLWVVYPQRSDKAPVVVVVHEVFGLTPWIRSVADQLAADGFIAVAPDLLTTNNVAGTAMDGPERKAATAAMRAVTPDEVNRQIDAAAKYAMALGAALPSYGVVGYCWGGAASFAHAVHSSTLGALVVYYGTSPAVTALSSIRAPVLGLYAGNDTSVNATVPAADSAMKALKKPFTSHVFAGAGRGFLRQSNALDVEASKKAWPITIQFLKSHLEGR